MALGESTSIIDILKTLDTIGNFQRPVFSLVVSQHKQKIANLWKFKLNIGRRSCEIKIKEKTPLSHEVVCFQTDWFRDLKF